MTDYVSVWDGRQLRDYNVPLAPVTLRERDYITVDDRAIVPRRVRPRGDATKPKRRYAGPGPVFRARPRLWALLAEPQTVGDLMRACGLKQRSPLSTALSALLRAGVLEVVDIVTIARGRSPQRYRRTAAYQSVAEWPRVGRGGDRG